MGVPIVESVQESKQSSPDHHEKGGVSIGYHHDHDDQQQQPFLVKRPPLAELMAYANASYMDNDIVGHGDKRSPRASLLKSPLMLIWGPPTPALANGEKPLLDGPAFESVPVIEGETNTQHQREIELRRKLRSVSGFGIFFLITTDILGPFNAPYAISQVGYVPGILLYLSIGITAWYGGMILSSLFLRIDSEKYPVKDYGHLMYKILGPWARVMSDVLLILQLVVNCGTLILSNAQSMAQIIDHYHPNFCFIVGVVVFLIVQLIFSPIRSLKGVGYFATAAVFLNVALMICTIAFVCTSPPNYAAALSSFGVPEGPVMTSAFVSQALTAKINGFQNMVFAYGGAQLFIHYKAEAARPWDFWKAMSAAQLFIGSVYMTFGLVVYSQQGQFTESLAYYGVSGFAENTVGNVIAIITGAIAALLYANIGTKVLYSTIVERWCNGPALMTSKGWLYWMILSFIFWPISFVVGAAIPQIQTLSGLVAACCLVQFSYSFPFLMKVVFDVKVQAMHADPGHTIGQAQYHQVDTWASPSRWKRGFFGGTMQHKILVWGHLTLFLAALSMSGLGMYGSGESIKGAFEEGAATSFGCAAPA